MITKMYHLRAICDDDYDFLWRLNEETLRAHVEVIWGWDEEVQRAHFQDRMKRDSDKRLILVEGRRIGYLELKDAHALLHIVNIQISSRYQGRGLGGRVVQDLLVDASTRGFDVTLSVFKVNTRALRFYERLSFQIVGSTDTHWELLWSYAHP